MVLDNARGNKNSRWKRKAKKQQQQKKKRNTQEKQKTERKKEVTQVTALTLLLQVASQVSSFMSLFFSGLSLSSIIFIISDSNYMHLLLSQLHFVITLSHYNTPCKYIW